jgi:hypothetical protein
MRGFGRTDAFTARCGPVKRVLQLLKRSGPVTAVRGGCSLLYARLTTERRVRGMQDWSKDAVDFQARLAMDGIDRPVVGRTGIDQLLAGVTKGCAKSVQPDVFHRVAVQYCRHAEEGQLAALRRALGTGLEAPGVQVLRAPESDPARIAWETLSAALDSELSRRTAEGVQRTMVNPLTDIARALARRTDGVALDQACARLAVALRGDGDDNAAPDIRVLAAALNRLGDAERRELIAHLSSNAPRPPGMKRGMERKPGSFCALAATLLSQHRTPELRERRLELVRVMHAAARLSLDERLDYFVQSTSSLIDYRRAAGMPGYAIYELAARSLKTSLDTLRYEEFSEHYDSGKLVPRLIALALAGKSETDTHCILAQLKPDMLADLIRETQGADDAALGGVVRMIREVDKAREDHLGLLRCIVDGHIRMLEEYADRGNRWGAAQELRNLDLSLEIWNKKREPSGMPMPADIVEALHVAVPSVLARLFRNPDNPAGPLNRASIAVLCESEIRCLRESTARLREYGLRLDAEGLKEEARVRSRPHEAMAVRYATELFEALADKANDVDRVMRALSGCAHAFRMACVTRVGFMTLDSWDIAALSTDIAAEARRALAGRDHEHLAVLRSKAGFGIALSDNLSNAARLLGDYLDEKRIDSEAERQRHPVGRACSLARLASVLMTALATEFMADDAEERRRVHDVDKVSAWTPALHQAAIQQFGLDYTACRDARTRQMDGKANTVMTMEQCLRFATALLAVELTVKEPARLQISASDGTTSIEVDSLLILDGVDRSTAQFSVCGVNREGRYIAYTSSEPVEDETSRVPGMERAVLALRRLADADTLPLTAYMSQAIGTSLLRGLAALGADSPVKLADGRAALPIGQGDTRTDVSRLADGSYMLRLSVTWAQLRSAIVADAGGRMEGMELDPAQSYASLSCGLCLKPDLEGGWIREVIHPLDVRYRMIPRASSDA